MSTKDWLEKDYYAILGVPKDADQAAIKRAYRKLARDLHPDRNKDDAATAERFKAVSEANSVLSDPEQRKQYDEARSLFGGGGRFRVPTGGRAGGGGPAGGGLDVGDLGDLLNQGGAGSGGLGDLFGGLFGGASRSTRTVPRRGQDIESEVALGFTEAVEGATVKLNLRQSVSCKNCAGTGAKPGTVPRVCPRCQGTGHLDRNAGGFSLAEPCPDCRGQGLIIDEPCPVCHGTGRETQTRPLTVRIPAGVKDGQRIRLKGKGGPGERGGPAGDLFVVVHVQGHSVFGRSGDNLTVTVPVTFAEAALGAEIKVPTLGGVPVTVRLAPGTGNGRTLRVRGKGARRSDGSAGDLLVTVDVAVPQRLDTAARESLEAYAAATAGDDPRAELLRAAASG